MSEKIIPVTDGHVFIAEDGDALFVLDRIGFNSHDPIVVKIFSESISLFQNKVEYVCLVCSEALSNQVKKAKNVVVAEEVDLENDDFNVYRNVVVL